ncbi:MAG: hypothetical protein HFG87_10025 [Dorea sp.]|nr:hypothetical protein [Dorea sp.]
MRLLVSPALLGDLECFINIEIKPKSKLQDFFQGLFSKSEDLLFSIVQKLPESFTPPFLMNWLESYLDKHTQELQAEIIRQQWKHIHLEKAIEEIHHQQDNREAP